MIDEFLLNKKPVSQESTKKHFMKLNKNKHLRLKTNNEEMEKLQKEIIKQYQTVNNMYSPDKVKANEGKTLKQTHSNPDLQIGYSKKLSPKLNKKLLENYFYMKKRVYYPSPLFPGTSSLFWLSKLGN